MRFTIVAGLWLILICAATATAADWGRFRGPNGSGVSEQASPPVEWSETKNMQWKTALPGPGSSSPVVVGDHVYITCYSGYGESEDDPGEMSELTRHLLCIDRHSGDIVWNKAVPAVQPEDPYRGFITEHGYASSTPVSDGERLYVFFGKTGVLAFDLDGNELWRRSVGTESGPQRWGSGASPVLYKDLVIVNAAEESESLVALNKETGEQIWKAEAAGLSGGWGTPVLVQPEKGETELALVVPYEIWGLNPDTGKLLWYAEVNGSRTLCTSAVAHDGVVYALGGMSGEAVAVKAGGDDDVTGSRVLWSAQARGRITSPVYYQGRLYWQNSGVATCLDAATGERLYQERLPAARGDDRQQERRGGFRRGRFGGRGGPGGGDYASPIAADGKIYLPRRNGDVYVIAAGPEFKLLAHNRLPSDGSDFNGSPAVSQSQLFLRSNEFLYCVSNQ